MESHHANWWDGEAYRFVRHDINYQLYDHIQKIEFAKQELKKNALKPQPSFNCIAHNAQLIQRQLNAIQGRFQRWRQAFTENGDISRWQQMPGAHYWITFNWMAILPDLGSGWSLTVPNFWRESGAFPAPGYTNYGNFQPPGASSFHGPTNYGNFKPPGAFPAPRPTNSGTFQPPGAFPAPGHTNYGNFQPPGASSFHGHTNYGIFQSPGAFPAHSHTSFGTFQPQGSFQAGTPSDYSAFRPQAYLPDHGITAYNASQPQEAFLHSGIAPAERDAFEPTWTECLPTITPTNHRLSEPARSLPPRDTASHQATKPTASSSLNILDGQIERAEPTKHQLPHAQTEQHSPRPTASKPQAAPIQHVAKQLLADVDRTDYFGEYNRKSDRTFGARNQPSAPKNTESTARHFSTVTPPPRPSAKRRLSPSPAENTEHGAKHINAKGYKKQSAGPRDQPARFQDFLIGRRRPTPGPSKYPPSRYTPEIPEEESDGEETWTFISRSKTANNPGSRQDTMPPAPTKAVEKETEGSVFSSPWSLQTQIRMCQDTPVRPERKNHKVQGYVDERPIPLGLTPVPREKAKSDASPLERSQDTSPEPEIPVTGSDLHPASEPEEGSQAEPQSTGPEMTRITSAGDHEASDPFYEPSSPSRTSSDLETEESPKTQVEEVTPVRPRAGRQNIRDDNGSRDRSSSLPSVSKLHLKPAKEPSALPRTIRPQDKKPSGPSSNGYDKYQLTLDTIAEFGEKTRAGPKNSFRKVPATQQWERWQLRHAFTESWRARAREGLADGRFVPLPVLMCDYGVDLTKITLEEAIRQHMDRKRVRNWGLRANVHNPRRGNVVTQESHECHTCACEFWWHLLYESHPDNLSRECEGCHMIERCRQDNNGAVPLQCFKHALRPCLTGAVVLSKLEKILYQFMAANDYASFHEIPDWRIGNLDSLDKTLLNTPLITYTIEERTMKILGFDDHPTGRCVVPASSHFLSELIRPREDTSDVDESPLLTGPSQNLRPRTRISREHETLEMRQVLLVREMMNHENDPRGDDEDPEIHDAWRRKRAELQHEAIRLFRESPAGQECDEQNREFTHFAHGKEPSGLYCVLCQTIVRTEVNKRKGTLLDRRDHLLVSGATKVFKHILLTHDEYEPSVRCDELLKMLEGSPRFRTFANKNGGGGVVADLMAKLRRHEMPTESDLVAFNKFPRAP